MSIIYICLNKAIFLVLLKLAIVLFSFQAASASSCESTSENNFDVVVGINNSNVDSFCEYKPFSIPSGTECEESSSRKEISESDLEEELRMKEETKNELLKRLFFPTTFPRRSEFLESNIFTYVKNLLYPDFLKEERGNPKYKYVVLFAAKLEPSLLDENGGRVSLITYRLIRNIKKSSIISANLWFFTGHEPGEISILEVERYRLFLPKANSTIVDKLPVRRKKWYKISITWIVENWEWFTNRPYTIEMKCHYCRDYITPKDAPYGLLPFVALEIKTFNEYADVISTMNEKNRVTKASEICKKPITIDFKSLGLSEWIVYPKRFNTNYCKGTCVSSIDKSYCRAPISIMEGSNEYIYDWKNTPNICCVPIRSSTLEIGYMMSPFIAVFTTLPNMTVEECGCRLSPDI